MIDIVETLNALVMANKDGVDGYRLAAKRVKDVELRTLFQQRAEQHAAFMDELRVEVRRHGGRPEDKKTGTGQLLTEWMVVADTLDGAKPLALLEEVLRLGRTILSHYQSVLKKKPGWPADLRSLVMRQYEQIVAGRDQLAGLAARPS